MAAFLAWSYLAGVLVAVALLWLAGDRWWIATLFTFGPRWSVLLPLPIVVPLAMFFSRRSLWPILVAAALAAGPVMGFCLPWREWIAPRPPTATSVLRVVTYNCGGGGAKPGVIGELVRRAQPDVLVLNEGMDVATLTKEMGEGWYAAQYATQIFSRFPIISVKKIGAEGLRKPWRKPALSCEIKTPWGAMTVVGVHLDTPREGLTAVHLSRWRGEPEMDQMIEDRRTESERASRLARESKGPVVVAGDFNMPVDSRVYREYWQAWQNAYSTAGLGCGYTKHTRHWGARIDHVLASDEWRIRKAHVGPDLGGDHRPLVVDVQLR